jgi:hypothetical protein
MIGEASKIPYFQPPESVLTLEAEFFMMLPVHPKEELKTKGG